MQKNDKARDHKSSYKMAGGRIGVLLVHSLGGLPQEMGYLANSFARAGYTVSCPFIPGMTAGTDISGISTWEDWYASVSAAYDDLLKTCDEVYVGGLSAGAVLSLRLAEERPERIAGIILLAPTLWPNGWAIPWYFNFFRLIRDRYSARLFHFRQRAPFGIKDERIRKFVFQAYAVDDRPIEDMFGRGGGLVYQFRRLVSHVKRRLGSITKPVLIMHPRFDDQSDLSNTFKLQRELGGPVETIVLEDCYHMVTLDRQRNLVVDRATAFVQRLVKEAAQRAAEATPVASQRTAGAAGGDRGAI